MTTHHKHENDNIYVPSILAILFILVVAAAVWITQVRPSTAEQTAVSPATEKAAAAVSSEPAEAREAPAQISTGDPAIGQTLFASCSACHGPTGQGLPGLGKDLTSSEFVAGQADADLISFIKIGRDPGDPLNTTGIAMPPKGGNPALSDKDLANIVAFIRSIQK